MNIAPPIMKKKAHVRTLPTYEYFEPRGNSRVPLHTGVSVTMNDRAKFMTAYSAIRHYYALNPHSPDWGFHTAREHTIEGVDGATITSNITNQVVGVFVRRQTIEEKGQ